MNPQEYSWGVQEDSTQTVLQLLTGGCPLVPSLFCSCSSFGDARRRDTCSKEEELQLLNVDATDDVAIEDNVISTGSDYSLQCWEVGLCSKSLVHFLVVKAPLNHT